MPTTKSPSNRDIIALLTINHEEVQQRLGAVEAQVKYTNGRVTKVEGRLNEQDAAVKAVEKYKKDNPTQLIKATNVTVSAPWFQNEKLVAAVSIFIVAIASTLSFLVGGGGK